MKKLEGRLKVAYDHVKNEKGWFQAQRVKANKKDLLELARLGYLDANHTGTTSVYFKVNDDTQER